MKKHFLLTATSLCLTLSFTSCKEDKKQETREETTFQQDSEEDSAKNAKLAFKTEKQEELVTLYLHLKDALVKSDSYSAQKIAEVMAKKYDSGTELDLVKAIINTEDIEVQRSAFLKLSTHMEKLVSSNIKGGTLFKQYCPMAFDGEGGFWLSDSKEIRNPYYGDKMLKCGEVTKTFK